MLAILTSFVLTSCEKNVEDIEKKSQIIEVSTIELVPKTLVLSTELPGRTSPFLIAEIRPQVGGILQKRYFEEGSKIQVGQPLYQIDPAPYKTTLAKAQANLEALRLLSKRYDSLVISNAVSQQDRDDARSKYLQAKASVESAKIDLGYTQITAPISGRIGRSSFTQGALLTANQVLPLATIQQLDPIYVDIVQSSTSLLRLKDELESGKLKNIGNSQVAVELTLENGKQYNHQGKLQFSEITVDEGTGAVTLRAVFPNPNGTLLPGMFVHAQLQEGSLENAILVPQKGITWDLDGKATALVVNNKNTVELRYITVDRTIGNNWLVSEGLSSGDKVIIEGLQKVQPGSIVHITSNNTINDFPTKNSSQKDEKDNITSSIILPATHQKEDD